MPVATRFTLPLARSERPGYVRLAGSQTSVAPADAPRHDLQAGASLPASISPSEFEQALRENFAAAHHLARWLTRTKADAEDALQEAILRAFRSFDRLRPERPRAWLLRIVRNCCYDLRKQQHERDGEATLEEEALPPDAGSPVLGMPAENPETRLLRMADARALEEALRDIAPEYREVFLLREIEGLAYKEIAEVANIPVGTVMSRLSRARSRLRALIVARERETA
jgi:RNA polymerase sigma-70 factor (ECF subfamily)